MDPQKTRVTQAFRNTTLGHGAIANQGYFTQCTFYMQSLSFAELRDQIRKLLSTRNDGITTDKLFRSVSQLSFLSVDPENNLCTRNDALIIENINNILSAADQCSKGSRTDHKSANSGNATEAEVLAEIKRMLTATGEVLVNHSRAIRRTDPRDTAPGSVSRSTHKFHLPNCTVTIQTWRRELRRRKGGDGSTEFTARINIQPQLSADPQPKARISVYFQPRCVSLPPMIIARRAISEYSEIFLKAWFKDDEEGAIKQLRNREVSLWICDSRGRSLLNYAMNNNLLELSKFLIQNGAEVNCWEPRVGLTGAETKGPLRPGRCNDSSIEETFANGCGRLLLESGVDPTIGGKESILLNALWRVEPQFERPARLNLHNLLDIGRLYIDTTERDEQGRTMLLQFCDHSVFPPTMLGIRYLIQQGSDIRTQDAKGDTCLHLVLSQNRYIRYPLRIVPGLIYLIHMGADIDVRNGNGFTPSDVAYVHANEKFRYNARISICWDYVLEECGIGSRNKGMTIAKYNEIGHSLAEYHTDLSEFLLDTSRFLLGLRMEKFGERHPDTLYSMKKVAAALRYNGKRRQLKKMQRGIRELEDEVDVEMVDLISKLERWTLRG